MRVRGDVAPPNAFSFEEIPKKPGFVNVRFYENVHEFSEQVDQLTMTGWEWDEYHLEMENTGAVADDILARYDDLLVQAKAMDGGAEESVWDILAAALSEGVNSVDDK